jgi:glycosyltransferase involved in cell wall biosynthesis
VPGQLEARIDDAESLFAAGDLAGARAALEALRPLAAGHGAIEARVLSDLAVIAAGDGRDADAAALLVDALRADPTSIDALLNLAGVCERAGDAIQGHHWLTRAVLHEPRDPEARRLHAAGLAGRGKLLEAHESYAVLERLGAMGAADRERMTVVERRIELLYGAEQAAPATAPTAGGRVLVAVDFFHPSVGGAEKLAEDAGAALLALGYEVHVATRALAERESLEHRGMQIHEIRPADALADLTALVGRVDYDAILVFSAPSTWPLLAPLQLPEGGPRRIVVPCVNAEGYALLHHEGNRRFLQHYAALLRGAEVVGYSARAGFDARMLGDLGLPGAYVPNAVPRREPRGDFRAELGIAPDTRLLLQIGNFWPEKNHLGLLRELASHPGDWRLVVIGHPSPDAPELAGEIAAAAERDPRVTVVPGAAPETVAAAMDAADVLLLPSRADATPLVLLEAMSRELPWIATPNCGSAHDHAGGLIVPLADFGRAIDFVLGEPGHAAALGRAGHAHWRSSYTWDVIAPRYAQLIEGRALQPLDAPPEALEATEAARSAFYDSRLAVDVAARELPTVTCVMTAHNYERYVAGAIRSALDQDYPPELLDVVVVDDGSTDATADRVRAIAAESGGRVTLVQQQNAGLAAATSTALANARGELVAILDADDLWLPGKVRRQVELLLAHPEVGLVYGDMTLIDSEGTTIDGSYFASQNVVARGGHVLDELAKVNFTTNSTLLFRAEVLREFLPIPADSPYADYWLALHAALRAPVAVVPGAPLSAYRRHDSNMSFGASGRHLARELGRELRIQRMLLTGPVGEAVALPVLLQIVGDFEPKARWALQQAGTIFFELVPISPADRERCAQELATCEARLQAGDGDGAVRAAARAWLMDPASEQAARLLAELTESAAAAPAA